MNALDQIQDLYEKLPMMPIHTDVSVKIPRSYSQGLPKNLMDYSTEKMEDFINPTLSIIEEIGHRDKSSTIPKWFLNYYMRYYRGRNLLKGDSYFQSRMRDGYRKHLNPNFAEIREVGLGRMGSLTGSFVNFGKLLGTLVEVDGSGTSTNSGSANALYAGICTTATNQAYYDYMNFSITSAAGNVRVGVYDNNSTLPNNLLSQSSSTVAVANYTTNYSITEFQATATTLWFAESSNNASNTWNIKTSGYTGKYLDPRGGDISLNNPFGTPTGSANSPFLRLGHT